MPNPSASYSFTIRIRLERRPGTFARVAAAIAECRGDLGAVDIARTTSEYLWRDITVAAGDTDQAQAVVDAISEVDGVVVEHVSDRTFLMHLGGKIALAPRVPLKTRDDLSMAYTPGVGRICEAIAEDKERAFALTSKRNTVAVVSDGSAVLGLGDIGPEAAMPVMEGKALLFKRFADVDAWPICLDTQDVDEIVSVVRNIAPGFGGINLEDISAPRCFEIARRLREELDIPVFHDDQHGTAVVVLAALIGTARLLRRELSALRVVVLGAGAAGTAVARILVAAGVHDIVGVDRHGVIHADRGDIDHDPLTWWGAATNPRAITGTLDDALTDADVFIGLSGPNLVSAEQVARMAPEASVFAMANPVPEILPEQVPDNVRVMATGRSDYPNQINNVLCFPGLFRGALDVRATTITEEMKVAAAHAIAKVIPDEQLGEDYIIPSVFNEEVATAVAAAVAESARACGVARRMPDGAAPLRIPGASV
ncbi:MAG: NAD-dependent malic enzyme [Thermoleophilia bacterium]|nr:NAD-dependent malic enzyme [Thermoleophilia bacterium]